MPNNLDQIVRPFQLPQTAPPERYITQGQPSIPPVIVTAGRSGVGKTFTGSYDFEETFYLDQEIVEQSQ